MPSRRNQSAFPPHILSQEPKKSITGVLNYEMEIVLPNKLHSFLYIARSSRIYTDHRYIPLLTRDSKRSIEITRTRFAGFR
jgi:hypothetical protein